MGFAPSSLRDNFTDNTISTSAWTEAESGSATATETTGQIRFTLPSSTAGTHIARRTSRYTYDLTSDSFFINIETMVATGVAATAFFQLYLSGANTIQWIQVSGTLYARSIVAGVSTDRYSASWSGTTYKYLRIRADTTTVYWDSSTNGTSWTNRASLAISSLFAITDLSIDFGATCGNVASPGSFRLDDVNLILPALATNWRWTQARRALVNRNRVETLAVDAANTAQGYLVTADGVDASDAPSGNIRYWSGPAGGGRLLTEQPDEASAQAMAVNIPLDGRFDLPEMIDMRVVRLGHRSIDGSSYVLREFFPRRLVQADDIEAEAIRALHIAAEAIQADHISATAIDGKTITGATIRTAASGERWEATATGARTYSSAGVVQIEMASGNDGALTAYGLAPIQFKNNVADATVRGSLGYNSVSNVLALSSSVSGSIISVNADLRVSLAAQRLTRSVSEYEQFSLIGTPNFVQPTITTEKYGVSGIKHVIEGISLLVDLAGTGTDPQATIHTTGDLLAEDIIQSARSDSATNTAVTCFLLRHRTSATPAANFGTILSFQADSTTTDDQNQAQIAAQWTNATHASRTAMLRLFAFDSTGAREFLRGEANGSAVKIGFFGAGGVVQPTVSGSRGGNAALANLLTALANLGLVIDSTT